MEHYVRGEVKEEPLELADLPFNAPPDQLLWMKVKQTSRVGNMVAFARKQLNTHTHVLWSGSGQAINKTIMSAELLKKSVKQLHQETHCCYIRSVELWKPREIEALDTLEVNKDVPSIHILLSKTALNPDSPSYQAPGSAASFWTPPSQTTTTQTKKPTLADPTAAAAAAGNSSLKKRRRRGPRPD